MEPQLTTNEKKKWIWNVPRNLNSSMEKILQVTWHWEKYWGYTVDVNYIMKFWIFQALKIDGVFFLT